MRMFKDLSNIFANFLSGLLSQSNYSRWSNSRNLEDWWESRTKKIAAMIPRNRRVLEFGAGRRWLEEHVDPSCPYIPSDLIDRGPGTIICDLNRRPLPDLRYLRPEVAVFSGVLEYIRDIPSLLDWLNSQASFCVASYAYRHGVTRGPGRVKELLFRARFGYMNHYTEEELLTVFERAGFSCLSKDTWEDQRLFLFENQRLMKG
jgi:hypothetical protein